MDTPSTRRPRRVPLVLVAALLMLVLLAALLGRTLLPIGGQSAAAQDGLIAFEHYAGSTPPQIAVINADGTNLTPLPTDGQAFDPAWSPDGTKIAYYLVNPDDYRPGALVTRGDIYVMDADGSNPTRLTTDGQNLDPAWSPDGTKIAFVSDPESEPAQIHVMDADGTNITPLTAASDRGSSLDPAWSPDGTRIAFASSTPGDLAFGIYVMDADGANPTELIAGEQRRSPAWSPDGAKIVFTDIQGGSIYTGVYVMDADGANVTRLTPSDDSSHYMDPAWSPDGSMIAVASDREENALRIFLMDASGRNLTRLGSEYGTGPAWAPSAAAAAP